LITAFGKLINGETTGLIPPEALDENIENLQAKMEPLIIQAETTHQRQQAFQVEVKAARKKVADYTESNGLWYEAWEDDNDSVVAVCIEGLKAAEKRLAKASEQFGGLESKIKSIQGEIAKNEYMRLMNKKGDYQRFLLSADDQLGDSLPAFLQEKVDETRSSIERNETYSEFERLFYAGNYTEALKSLGKQNEARNKTGMNVTLPAHDVTRLYRKYLKSAESTKFKTTLRGFAAGKIKEGYVPIPYYYLQESARDYGHNDYNPEKTLRHIYLVKEQEDGSLSYIVTDPVGNFIQEMKMGGRFTKGPIERTISAKELTGIDIENEELKTNFQATLEKMPAFQGITNLSKTLNNKIQPLLQLYGAG